MTVDSPPVRLSPAECTCFRVRSAARRVTQIYSRHLAPTGLRISQFSLLGHVISRGPVSITELSELVARLAALLRRAEIRSGATTVLRLGNLRVDTERRRAHVATELLDLTRREFDLLAAFATNPGVVLSRVGLLELVWGYDFDVDTNVVDVFVGYLRGRCQQPAHSSWLQNRSLRITLLVCGVQSFCLQAWVLGRRDHACGPNSSGHHRPRRRLRSPEGPGDRGRSVGSLVGGDLAAAR